MKTFKKFKYSKTKKQHRDWVLRYAMVVATIMLISFLGQGISSAVLRREASLANRNVVKQTGILCDNYITDMENAANRLIVSDDVLSIYKKYAASPEDMAISVKNIISQQESVVNANKIIKNSMVVFAQSDICITHETRCTKEIMYHMFFEDYYKSARECLEDIFIDDALQFKYLEDQNGNGRLFYIYAFIYGTTQEIKSPAVVVFELDFKNAVGISVESEIGDFFVTDSKDRIVFYTGIPDKAKLLNNNISGIEFNKKDYMLNYSQSEVSPVKYYHIIEKSLYMKNVNAITSITIVCLFLCLVAGGVMAYVFGKRDYLLVNRILDKMYNDEKAYKTQRSRMEEFYLQNYLKGNLSPESEKAFGDFKEEDYVIVLIDVCDFGIYKEDEHDMALFCIRNVFDDMAKDSESSIFCNVDGVFVCLMNFDFSKDGIDKIKERIDFTADFLNMHFGMEIKATISEVCSDMVKLPELYLNVRENLSFGEVISGEEDCKKEMSDERIAAICKYVDANYSDGNLSVQGISEHFGMSFNYISKYFKQQQGEGLAKYIILKRISAAKTLLVNTNYSIAKIASETGFFSSNVFIRSFKKVEGTTPGQYRKDNAR